MKQSQTPLWTSLKAYNSSKITPFHTPGHKLNPGPFTRLEEVLGPGFFQLDPSDEIHDPNLNHDFELALKFAEQLAADLFGAQDSLFLVNGTTGGLHYLLMPTTGPVIIPRFSHQAVYSALMLAQAESVYLEADYDPDWLIPLQPRPNQVKKVLAEKQCQALLITHPTYYGTVSELSEIIHLAKKHGVLVFADEAHGGHFLFSNQLPETALASGADAVVQSTHKTLGSFTQTSMLHSNNHDWFSKAIQAKQILETTSPSLVFLAALDEVRRVLAMQGPNLIEHSLELARNLTKELDEIPFLELLPAYLQSDPSKVIFSLRSLGLTGIELERILRLDYNIQVELSDYYSVLALISFGDTKQSIEKLVKAVRDIVDRRSHLGQGAVPHFRLDYPSLPPIRSNLRETFFRTQEIIPLEKARGRISGSFLTPYPPGVPIIVPGEEFTADIVDYLSWCKQLNWSIRGLMEGQKVAVLKG